MLKKILVILAVLLVFANECFALEGRKIANVGAEMLYTRILQTCVNNGISQNSFSELYKGNGEFYTYFFYPQNDNVIQTTLDYNNDGYVTLISIDGAGLDEQQRLTVYGMAVACLKALNITETEMQYLFDNLQTNIMIVSCRKLSYFSLTVVLQNSRRRKISLNINNTHNHLCKEVSNPKRKFMLFRC